MSESNLPGMLTCTYLIGHHSTLLDYTFQHNLSLVRVFFFFAGGPCIIFPEPSALVALLYDGTAFCVLKVA